MLDFLQLLGSVGGGSSASSGRSDKSLFSMLSSSSTSAIGSIFSSHFQISSTLKAAEFEQSAFNLMSQQKDLQATQVQIQSTQQANEIRNRLLDNIASADASFAGRNIAVSTGTPAAIRTESRRLAQQELSSVFSGSRMTQEGLREEGRQLRFEGMFRKEKGLLATMGARRGIGESLSLLAGGL